MDDQLERFEGSGAITPAVMKGDDYSRADGRQRLSDEVADRALGVEILHYPVREHGQVPVRTGPAGGVQLLLGEVGRGAGLGGPEHPGLLAGGGQHGAVGEGRLELNLPALDLAQPRVGEAVVPDLVARTVETSHDVGVAHHL